MSDHVEKYSAAYVDEYVRSAVQGFVGDPPDSNYQSGYLAALLVVAQEALGASIGHVSLRRSRPAAKTPKTSLSTRVKSRGVSGGNRS